MDFRKGEIIAIDKPYRMSSFGALAHVRYLLSKKLGFKVKIGHAVRLTPLLLVSWCFVQVNVPSR